MWIRHVHTIHPHGINTQQGNYKFFSFFLYPQTFLHLFYICFTFALLVSLFVCFTPLSDSLLFTNLIFPLPAKNSLYLYLFMCNSSFVRSQDQYLTLLFVPFSFVFISHLTNVCSLLCYVYMYVCLYSVQLAWLGSKRNANNHYVAIIVQVL